MPTRHFRATRRGALRACLALLATLTTLAGCTLPEARPPLVDPLSSLIEEWRQEELAGDSAARFLMAFGTGPRDARSDEQRLHHVAGRILEANAELCGQRVVMQAGRPRCAVGYRIDERQTTVNAYARPDGIVFSRAMLRFVGGEAELALVFGHELAHILLGHHDKKERNAQSGAAVGRIMSVISGEDVTEQFSAQGRRVFQRSFEREADYVGLYYVARAGFDIAGTAAFWRRMGLANPAAISEAASHPTTAERYLAIAAAVAEIERKRSEGRPLLPDKR